MVIERILHEIVLSIAREISIERVLPLVAYVEHHSEQKIPRASSFLDFSEIAAVNRRGRQEAVSIPKLLAATLKVTPYKAVCEQRETAKPDRANVGRVNITRVGHRGVVRVVSG